MNTELSLNNNDFSKGVVYRMYNRIVGPTKDKTRYFIYINIEDAKENYIMAKYNIPELERRFPDHKFYAGIECFVDGQLDLKKTWDIFSDCYDILNKDLSIQ